MQDFSFSFFFYFIWRNCAFLTKELKNSRNYDACLLKCDFFAAMLDVDVFVFFLQAGNPCLSCFDLVKNSRDGRSYNINFDYMPAYMPPECLNGIDLLLLEIHLF